MLISIPTTLLTTFIAMQLLGFSLNFLSTLGLTLTIGILVDDSIVVLENIMRHLSRGEAPRAAALMGRAEIGLAAVAITLVDVVVFSPTGLVSGQIGGFFRHRVRRYHDEFDAFHHLRKPPPFRQLYETGSAGEPPEMNHRRTACVLLAQLLPAAALEGLQIGGQRRTRDQAEQNRKTDAHEAPGSGSRR